MGGRHATSVRRKNIRKSQSDVGMAGNSELLLFESFPAPSGYRGEIRGEISPEQPRLKRHMSEQTAQSNYDDELDVVVDDDYDYENGDVIRFGVEHRTKRNKENNRVEDEVPRVNRAQTEGWLRVRNHMVREKRWILISIIISKTASPCR